MKKKWEYSVRHPGLIARAISILDGENEQIMTRKNPKFTPITPEQERLGRYGTATTIVSEEEALKAALALGATKEDFYAE